ncbi:mucin, putative, partial [Ixodes scapularis]
LTRGTRTTIVTSTSTTASPSSKVQASTTTPAPRTGLAFHSKPPVTPHVSVPTASPLVIQTSAPTSVVTRAPDVVDTPTNLYLPDPLVPDEKDEEDREDRPETPASAVTKPASSHTVQTTAPTPASAVSEDSVTVASVPPTKQPEDTTTQPSTPHQDPVVRTTVAHAETTATGVSPASEASQGPVPASDMMPSEDAGGATIELPSNSETKPLSTSGEPAEEPATSEGHDRDNMPSIPKREEATHVAPDVSQSTEGAPHDFESPMGESPPPVAEAEDHDGDAESEKATLNIDEALDDVQAEVPGLEPLE